MLVFCEDCGEKNSIDLSAVRKAGNLYRCDSCHFLNQLLVKQDDHPTPNPTKQAHFDKVPYLRLLQEIALEETIAEAYIYDRERGIIAGNVFDDFSNDSMLKIGQALSFCCNMGSKILSKTNETCLVLTNKVVLGRNIEKNSRLIICCKSYPLPPQVTSSITKAIANFQVYNR